MNMVSVVASPFGYLQLTANNDALIGCIWTSSPTLSSSSPILKTAAQQLKNYFKKKLTQFDLPLSPEGTDFQKNVWDALLQIPYGSRYSYQDIATAIGNSKAARAVGSANAKNPLCIFIPCHRVIRASGDMGGYSGGIHHKHELLQLETTPCTI
jgi:methylated-DNA-[protein]-cysteine S-methyltransferase